MTFCWKEMCSTPIFVLYDVKDIWTWVITNVLAVINISVEFVQIQIYISCFKKFILLKQTSYFLSYFCFDTIMSGGDHFYLMKCLLLYHETCQRLSSLVQHFILSTHNAQVQWCDPFECNGCDCVAVCALQNVLSFQGCYAVVLH